MKFDHVVTFLEIASCGNFNRAAENLNVTQSTVSARIRQLEQELDTRLFERGLSPLFPGGGFIVTLAVILFGVSTAISWSYYGDRAVRYLFGPSMIMPYKILYCLSFMFAATVPLKVVWDFGDLALGLMAIPNLIAILALSGVVVAMTSEYTSKEHKRFK